MKQTAMITGASGAVGEAAARLLAKEGYDLVLTCCTREEKLSELCHELSEKYSVSCKGFRMDISSYEEVRQVFTHLTRLDVLINNAGKAHIGLLQDMTPELWNDILSVNLSGCFYTCKEAIPLMLSGGGGRILNISSVWGNVGASTEVAYSAAKGGMNSFTKALAKELAPSRISVNALALGVIDTPMNDCFDSEEKEALKAEIPYDRFGTTKEAAEMILQLLHAPDYLTGQIVTMDGGWY